jgi:hypothetical protein
LIPEFRNEGRVWDDLYVQSGLKVFAGARRKKGKGKGAVCFVLTESRKLRGD